MILRLLGSDTRLQRVALSPERWNGGVRRCVVGPVVLSQSGLEFRIWCVQAQFEQPPGCIKIGDGFQIEHKGVVDGRQ